ncbi:GNAT family N-acetyltransferase [Lentzea jiangxiensis]|uniref:Predicted acetyltransferase n=1 Tax=Lentzea jiangxiensis TaxID=641025 RepID=A0A1H0TLY7_9PSEU|nr:GNAT family N-acetyltransferase [Lentzea jiangxiensis]SDP55082.1 Predicted acetyltransferase [Lentzea jiangxiensis]
MADSALSIRTIDRSDVPEFQRVMAWAFLDEPSGEDSKWLKVLEHDRAHAVFDRDEMIGTAAVLTRELTVPGDRTAPVGAVTVVSVKPGHRRRGVATLLMETQLHGMHDGGEPIAILWASEGSIYRRYGYGEYATTMSKMKLPTHMPFHAGVHVSDMRIRQVTREEALPFMREVHDRVRRTRVGWLSRVEHTWDVHLGDREVDRGGLTAYRYALHPEGYVVFRVKHDGDSTGPRHELHVRELVCETDQAYADLYRFLLDMDLASSISFFSSWDDPVLHMVDNPRKVVREASDALWVRIVDVDRALPLRRYSSDVDSVLEVEDRFCPWNSGRWRFTVRGGEAVVTRTEDPADVSLDIAALGSAFLGGARLSVLKRAHRVAEHTPGHVDALTIAFLGAREPHCPEVF